VRLSAEQQHRFNAEHSSARRANKFAEVSMERFSVNGQSEYCCDLTLLTPDMSLKLEQSSNFPDFTNQNPIAVAKRSGLKQKLLSWCEIYLDGEQQTT
jgi:hypothetical protein